MVNGTGQAVSVMRGSGLVLLMNGHHIEPSSCSLHWLQQSPTRAQWRADCALPNITVFGSMDYTGFLDYRLHSVVSANTTLQLSWQASAETAVLAMGLGYKAAKLGALARDEEQDWLVFDFGQPLSFDGGWRTAQGLPFFVSSPTNLFPPCPLLSSAIQASLCLQLVTVYTTPKIVSFRSAQAQPRGLGLRCSILLCQAHKRLSPAMRSQGSTPPADIGAL